MIGAVPHLSRDELEAALDDIRLSPKDAGELRLIVRRPDVDEREVVEAGEFQPDVGLVGDNWRARGSTSTPDGTASINRQITVMNARVARLVAGDEARMALAGDQLYVDFDLSVENLPPGTLVAIGDVVLEVSEEPHLGCAKFVERFGEDAMRFVNSRLGRQMRLRGLNARIRVPGVVRTGDPVTVQQLADVGQDGGI
jgi:hypothetical protein